MFWALSKCDTAFPLCPVSKEGSQRCMWNLLFWQALEWGLEQTWVPHQREDPAAVTFLTARTKYTTRSPSGMERGSVDSCKILRAIYDAFVCCSWRWWWWWGGGGGAWWRVCEDFKRRSLLAPNAAAERQMVSPSFVYSSIILGHL